MQTQPQQQQQRTTTLTAPQLSAPPPWTRQHEWQIIFQQSTRECSCGVIHHAWFAGPRGAEQNDADTSQRCRTAIVVVVHTGHHQHHSECNTSVASDTSTATNQPMAQGAVHDWLDHQADEHNAQHLGLKKGAMEHFPACLMTSHKNTIVI